MASNPYQVSPTDRDMLAIAQKMRIPYEQLRAANPNRTSVGTGEFINLPDVSSSSGGIRPSAAYDTAGRASFRTGDNQRMALSYNGQTIRLAPNSLFTPGQSHAPQKSFLQNLWDTLTGSAQNTAAPQTGAVRGALLPNESPGYNTNVMGSPIRPGGNQPPPPQFSGGVGEGSQGGYGLPNPFMGQYSQPLNSNAQPVNPNAQPFLRQATMYPSAGGNQPPQTPQTPQTPQGSFAAPTDTQFQNNEASRFSQGLDQYSSTLAYTGQAQSGYLPQTVSLGAAQQLGVPQDFVDPNTGAPGTPAQFMQSLGYGFDAKTSSWVKGAGGGAAQNQNNINIGHGRFFTSQQAFDTYQRGFKYKKRGGPQGYATNSEVTPTDTLAVRIGGG